MSVNAPIQKFPTLSAQTVSNISPGTASAAPLAHPLRFGSDDTVKVNLPAWAKNIKDPAYTQRDLVKLILTPVELPKNKKGSKQSTKMAIYIAMLKKGFNVWMMYRTISNARSGAIKQYLPEESKKKLNGYHWSAQYLYDRIFRPNHAKLMTTVYSGPMAIKAKQTEVESFNAQVKPMLELLLTTMSDYQKDPKKFEDVLKDGPKLVQVVAKPAASIVIPALKYYINRQLNANKVFEPLLNDVPKLPKEVFKTELAALEKEYNAKHPEDPIKKVGEAIKAGSVGQVFEAESKKGNKLVLKLIKPDITPAYLNACRPLLYYTKLLEVGTDTASKQKAARHAEDTANMLKLEVDLQQEAKNTQAIQRAKEELQLTGFKVPTILASTKSGMVVPYVGKQDLINLDTRTQNAVKQKMVPDLMKLLLLADTKPLDIHSGNVRTDGVKSDGVPYLIDHGRQANLNPKVHQKLLNLMAAVFATPKVDRAVSDKNVQDKLEEVLKQDETSNQSLLDDLQAVRELNSQKFQEMRERYYQLPPIEREGLDKRLKSQDNLMIFLGKLFIQPGWRLMGAAFGNISPQQDQKIGHASQLSLLNVWANYIQNTERQLPSLSGQNLSESDLATYKAKMVKFISPYLRPTADVHLLKSVTPEQLYQMDKTGRDFYIPIELGVLEKSMTDIHELSKPENQNNPGNQQRLESAQRQFKSEIDDIVKKNSTAGKRLAAQYVYNFRLKELSQTLADGLLQKSNTVLQNQDAYKALLNNVEEALSSDFAV